MDLTSILPELAFLDPIVQDNTLAKEFLEALYPQILFRSEAPRERWEARLGETRIFTRDGLLPPVVTPIAAGTDPTPKDPSFEQWSVLAAQYTDTMDAHMPSSMMVRDRMGTVLRNASILGAQAGQSINRLCRNKLYAKYCGGHTVATALGSGTTSLPVASLNGFTHVIQNGAEVAVSASATKAIRIGGASATINAATPDDSSQPLGPGVLTLTSSASWAEGVSVLADDRPYIVRSGGGTSVDAIASTDVLTAADIRHAVAVMRRDSIPTHPDGYYHLHVDPKGVHQVFADNEFQRLNESELDGLPYREFVLGKILGCLVIDNNQVPNVYTSDPQKGSGLLTSNRAGSSSDARLSPEFWAEIRNRNGVGLLRSIITGGESLKEMYIDELSEYMTEAGVVGKAGRFAVTRNGMQIPLDGIRFMMRAPLDRLMQTVSLTWSWSGDWGVPADLLGGVSQGRYKRAICIEHGSDD